MKQLLKNKLNLNGYFFLKSFLDKEYCINLRKLISKKRGNKFYNTKKNFIKNSRYNKCNPDLKFNYLNNFTHKYIDQKMLDLIPGKIISKKIVWNVNKNFLPNWLIKYEKYLIGNLNPYIKKKFQDETHFYGTHIHQDSLSTKNMFLTAYFYLDHVGKSDAPIEIFKKSHHLGISKFPISIKKFNKKYLYINVDQTMFTEKKIISGNPGDLIIFDSRCLHTTDTNRSNSQRISIRYLIKPFFKMKEFNGIKKHFTFDLKGDHLQLVGKYNK